jgi:cytosine/adenosine deaminase-related metal-dependent hydrolase
MTGRRTIIRGGLVLGDHGRAAPQDLLIDDGRIVAIENPGFDVSDDVELISASDRLLIPGLVNSHTHSHGALNRGAVDDKVSLEMFLTGAGASTRSRGIEDKYLSAALSAAEMIRKGCTACFDLTVELPRPSREGISAVARAYRDAGMRAVVAPMIADRTIYQAGSICRAERRTDRTDIRRLPGHSRELGVRPPPNKTRAGANHSAALLRSVPDRLRKSRARPRYPPADASGGIPRARRDREDTLWHEPGRASGTTRLPVRATERGACDLDR